MASSFVHLLRGCDCKTLECSVSKTLECLSKVHKELDGALKALDRLSGFNSELRGLGKEVPQRSQVKSHGKGLGRVRSGLEALYQGPLPLLWCAWESLEVDQK